MAEAIYNEGLKAVVSGVNPMLMKRGMDRAVEDIVEVLKKMSTKISDKKETEQVATVASNFDSEIGKMIAEATEKVGKDGVITVEEGKTLKTEVDAGRGDAVRPRLLRPPTSSPTWARRRPSSRTPTSSSTRRR